MSMLPPGVRPPGLMKDAPGARTPPARKPVTPQLGVAMLVVFVGLGALLAQLTSHDTMVAFFETHTMPTRATTHHKVFDHAKGRERPMYKPPTRFMFLGWVILHAVAGLGGYLSWLKHGFGNPTGRNAALSHAASVALHAAWTHALFARGALVTSVWIGRLSTLVLFVAVLANGRARFDSGAMHVPLAFATRELLRFATDVAAANA